MTVAMTQRWIDGTQVVAFAGELDAYEVSQIGEQLAVDIAGNDSALVFDFRALTYNDSSSLAMCMRTNESQRSRGHGFSVLAAPGPVWRVFEMTALDGLLNVRPTLEQAVAAASG